jgi:predicted dehydrogenase
MKSKLDAAVVGLRMGGAHLHGYKNNPHCRIVALCDPDSQLLAAQQKEFAAPLAVSDYRELLSNREIDVVSIASPDYYHAEQAIAFMRAGKHVLCEKPMTLNMAEARSIVATVKETGRHFMIAQVCRFAPGFVLTKKLIDRGEIGKLYFVESEYAHSYAGKGGAGNWRIDPRREPFIGGGCHAVDLLRWIAGDPLEAFAYANHLCLTDWPVNDCMLAAFKFGNDVIGKVMVSVGCVRPYTMRSVFYGTKGTIECDNTSPEIKVCTAQYTTASPTFARFPVDIANHNVSAEINELVDCILNQKPVPTNEIEGAKTVAACVAAVQSAKTGLPVKLSTVWES